MTIDPKALPPKYQAQVAAKLSGCRERQLVKDRKYHNTPTMRGDIRFDSKREAERYDELMLLLKAEEISELKLQPEFTLQEAYTTFYGTRVRAIRYRADFSYLKWGCLIVEDVKSKATKTREYRLKKKLMLERFGIEIQEV